MLPINLYIEECNSGVYTPEYTRVYTASYISYQGGRSERRTHGGNKCKHTRARDVTRDNLAKNSL